MSQCLIVLGVSSGCSQQELAQTKQEAAREGAAHQAARRAAADAAEDLKRLEFRYQRSIEQLEAQVRQMQRAGWARDMDGPSPAAQQAARRRREPSDPYHAQQVAEAMQPSLPPPSAVAPVWVEALIPPPVGIQEHGIISAADTEDMPQLQELLRLRSDIF